MELDQSTGSSEKTADHHQVVHVTWSPTTTTTTTTTSDDQDSSSGHTITRSYKCSFCQRGFSNAQALGGHMNIHRKDRARLKTTALSMDTTTTTKNQFSPHHLQAQESSSCSSVDERCSSQKRRPIIETADSDNNNNNNGELNLSLCIETSSSSNELKDESNIRHVKRSMHHQQQLSPGAPQKSELDLELRLGPDRTTN